MSAREAALLEAGQAVVVSANPATLEDLRVACAAYVGPVLDVAKVVYGEKDGA
jgi:hypothetical protein